MKINSRSQLAALAAFGSFAAPFLTSAQAAPSRQAFPLAGRNRDSIRNITVSGVVARDLAGQDRFTVRLDDNRVVEVIDRNREPLRLSKGDRVELRGDFERGLFIADSVRVTRNSGGGATQNTVLNGRVVRDFVGRDFELRRDNGTSTRVRSQRAEPIRLTQGDRVQVRGHFEGSLFIAKDVDIERNADQQRVDFPGTVVRRLEAGRLLVRGDNGRTFTVIANASLRRFDRDDRVRVKGFVNGDIVSAQNIELLKNR